MLVSLSIQNVVLIEKLAIEFAGGLCALTGETGAGKSILLDSLGLALGARSESGLVRKGAEQASVIASFDVQNNHPSKNILEEADLSWEPTLVLRRGVNADGRSKAYINDQPVSVGLLRQVGDTLVEVHGQFETQGLLNVSTHRLMLDEYAEVDNALPGLWSNWKTMEGALEALKADTEKSRAEEDYLRQAVEDLDALDPKAGEEIELAGLRERLMHREQVLEALNSAYEALNADNDPVRSAWGTIERVADKLGDGKAKDLTAALDRATNEVQEAVSLIQDISADLESSEHDLPSIDDRLFALRGQARKHNCAVDELPEIREQLAGKLNMIEHADDVLADKIKEVEAARGAYIKKAEEVRAARQKAASTLDGLVQTELAPLKLDKARFVTRIAPLDEGEWGPGGMDKIQFLVATNPGAEPAPLNKVASGGEMARFMLALKVVMAEVGVADTLVFDEVDTGIGGSTADAVGERLARLSSSKQILVVTHAPQVAARAQHHYIVHKDGADDIKTNIVQLDNGQERREEIARMLAGASITEEARAAADKLLESAA